MRPSAGFLLRFFALAAILFALWSFAGVGDLYARGVIALTNPVMRVLTGFWVDEIRPKDGGLQVFVRSADSPPGPAAPESEVPFNPREQFSGLIPFLALVGASSGLPWNSGEQPSSVPIHGLAPNGVCRAAVVTAGAVGSYPTVSPLPRSLARSRRFVFCCTFLGVSPTGCYPAFCSAEPGLSSRTNEGRAIAPAA